MDFVSFELAKKLKEKGFTCQHPIAMYNEIGDFCTLTTSADFQTSPSGYKCRCYYDYDDFDEYDFIAPTIAQVLKWLREEHQLHVSPNVYSDYSTDADFNVCNEWSFWSYFVGSTLDGHFIYEAYQHIDYVEFQSWEDAAIAGAEYVLNNLI